MRRTKFSQSTRPQVSVQRRAASTTSHYAVDGTADAVNSVGNASPSLAENRPSNRTLSLTTESMYSRCEEAETPTFVFCTETRALSGVSGESYSPKVRWEEGGVYSSGYPWITDELHYFARGLGTVIVFCGSLAHRLARIHYRGHCFLHSSTSSPVHMR